MFFYNLNHHWSGHQPDEGNTYEGVILNPSAFERDSGMKRALEGQISARMTLLDPQLYLLDLKFAEGVCPKFAKNLATYPWIGLVPPDFDSGQLHQIVEGEEEKSLEDRWAKRESPLTKWSMTVREAVNYQIEMGCDAIILPAPLIDDPATNLERDLILLEQAIKIAAPLVGDKHLYASLPLADTLFQHGDFLTTPLIEAIVDNLSTTKGIAGVYVPFIQVVSQAQDRMATQNASGALMRLARRFGTCTKLKIIFNFIESLGIVCRALGGYGYGTGYNLNQRRLHVHDCIPQTGGGGAFPKFYSLELCTDFLPSQGLERIAKKRLLGPLSKDRTSSSAPLLAALKARKSVNDNVPEWAEVRGNITAARHHYFEQHSKSHKRVSDPEEALTWLQEAEKGWAYLQLRFAEDPKGALEPVANHLVPWRKALERILEAEPDE